MVVERFLKLLPWIQANADILGDEIEQWEEEFLEALNQILAWFMEALNSLQAGDATLSSPYIYVKCLRLTLASIPSTNQAHSISVALNAEFDTVLDRTSPKYDPTFLIASALDPTTAKILSTE